MSSLEESVRAVQVTRRQRYLLGFVYCYGSLAIFSYAVFGLNRSPWWFLFMICVDVLYHGYMRSLDK